MVMPGASERGELPPLPLLGKARGRIVDFAQIYQHTNDDDTFDTLQDLAEELEGITSAHQSAQEDRLANGDDAKARVVCAPDQLAMLVTSSEKAAAGGDVAHSNKTPGTLGGTAKPVRQKGKAMRRFAPPMASPFLNALIVAESTRLRQLGVVGCDRPTDSESDELYLKVQQVPWERDILWGIDFENANDATPDDKEFVEETENQADAPRHDRRGTNDHKATVTASRPPGSRRKTPAVETPWVPSTAPDDFNMTQPRHYRWEIQDGATSSHSTRNASSSVSANSGKPELPCPLNKELESDAWINAIGWNSTQDMPDSKLVLDDNDAALIFCNPSMEDARPTLRIPARKLGSREIRMEHLDKQLREKLQRIDSVKTNIDLGEDMAEGRHGNDGTGKKIKDSRVVNNVGVVHHSLPAIKLSLTKPELPKAKLREFHRPRGKFKINERMTFVPAPVVALPPTEESAVVTQIKKSSDLNPTAGGKLILLEYTEQNPPVLPNPGMASRLLHYWRPPKDDDDGPPGKKKVKKPRPKAPEMPMGQVITLNDLEESPFIGNVPPGRMVTSLNSKLLKVPIFQHKPLAPFAPSNSARDRGDYELFLLCREVSKSKKGSLGLGAKTTMYLYEMPALYLAGQVEPQMEVPAPNSRSANEFIRPYMSFHILRLFKKASDGERLKIEDIARAFPNQSGTAIRKRMKEVATFERGGNDSGWWKKKPASQLTSEEEIRQAISPESVCLYESMMAGHRRLLDVGLTKLFTPAGVNSSINILLKRLEARKQALSAKMIEPLGLETRAREKAEQDLWKKDGTINQLKTDIEVARYIYEQLQLTPWNLTNNYVECHLQSKGSGMLALSGIGDPSGRGDGFSFVRAPQTRAKRKDGEDDAPQPGADSARVQKAVAAITGTTADLRKLTMKQAGDVLRNLGVPDGDIKKLRRWDRIHLLRELSNVATAVGRGGALSKFARTGQKTLSAQQQAYRRKCDVIYERQMNVLSATTTTFSSDEDSSEDEDILDELEEDLVGTGNLSNEREQLAKLGPRGLFMKGGGGLNRSKEALAERDEAVELERFKADMREAMGSTSASRRTDVDAGKLRSQLMASGINDGSASSTHSHGTRPGSVLAMSRGGSAAASAITTPTEHRSRASSPTSAGRHSATETPSGRVPGRKVIKRTTRVVEEDGSETLRIEFIVDQKQVARYIAKQQRQERQQRDEERNQLRKRKRMLALEDDAASLDPMDKAKRRKQLQDELKQLQKTEEQNKGYQEMLEKGEESVTGTPQKGVIRCTQCGQPGHMRTNRSCPLYMADGDDGKKGKKGSEEVEKITLNLGELREGLRKHQAEKKRKRMLEVKEQAELYKRPYAKAAVKQSRSRMPVAHLNGNLEIVINKLIAMEESELFRNPVDATTWKHYYDIIKQPIDLGSIKAKIQETRYDSMRDFIKDLELMVNNSRQFNGEPNVSPITANAVKVLKRAQEELASMHADGGLPPTSG
ncbi:hypothetical protein PINS_up001918 [Pythium insidiosum]|nr:hypothetical protein PINS_up001918 [Pythium insidiosum]